MRELAYILILGTALGLLPTLFTPVQEMVFGAPTQSARLERTILPETDSVSELGTSTKAWLRIFGDDLHTLNVLSCTEALETDGAGKIVCGTDATGAGGSFPYTPTSWGNSTSSVLGLLGGVFSNASSTFHILKAGSASTTNLTVSSLNSANCDVKASSDGTFSCGTDATGSGGGSGTVSTSTNESKGFLAYWASDSATPALLGEVATTSLTISSPLTTSGTAGALVGGSNLTIGIDTSGTWTGNAGTASALAANGSNCSAGSGAGGVSASGVAEDCTDYWTEAENTAAGYVASTRALTVSGTANQITSSAGSQTLAADRTWTLSLPSHVIFPSSYFAATGSTTNATSSTFFATTLQATSAFFTNVSIGADTLAEYIADTAGAMVSGNTESGIAVTYQDADNTLDFAVDDVTPAMLQSADFGDFTCNGVSCALDTAYFSSLADFTGTLTDGKICTYDLAGGEIDCDYTDQTGAGGAYPFTPSNNYSIGVSATTTPIWGQNGLHASGTSRFGTTTIEAPNTLLLGTATSSKQSWGGGGPESIGVQRAASNNALIYSGVTNDIEARWLIEVSGFMGWGAGGVSDQDINLFRNGTGNLTIESFANVESTETFRVNDADSLSVLTVNTVSSYITTPQIIVNGAGGGAKLDVYGAGVTAIRAMTDAAGDVAFSSFVNGDAQLRFTFTGNGLMQWGDGTSVVDTNLYRSAANVLTTDDSFTATVGISTAHSTSTASLTLPTASAPFLGAAGRIAVDTTSGNLIFSTSTAQNIVLGGATTTLYAFTVASTSPDFASGGIIPLPTHFLKQQVVGVICAVDGGTSQQIFLSDGTNDTNTLTCSTTETQYNITANNIWNAYESMRLEFVTKSGAPDYLHVRVVGFRTSD